MANAKIKLAPFDASGHLDDERVIEEYVQAALEDPSPELFFDGGGQCGQKFFLVLDATPSCAVVRSYGDKLICVSFDRAARTVSSEFRIFPATDGARVLRLEQVGPFKSG